MPPYFAIVLDDFTSLVIASLAPVLSCHWIDMVMNAKFTGIFRKRFKCMLSVLMGVIYVIFFIAIGLPLFDSKYFGLRSFVCILLAGGLVNVSLLISFVSTSILFYNPPCFRIPHCI